MSKASKNIKYIDRLDEFPVYRKDQSWMVFAYVSPETIINTPVHAIMIGGAFPTQEAAEKYAKDLRVQYPIYDIYVGEAYKTLGLGVRPTAENAEYREEELQKLISGYKDNHEKAKKLEAERRKEINEEAYNKHNSKSTHDTKTGARLKKILDNRKTDVPLTDDDKESETESNGQPIKRLTTPPLSKEEFEKREQALKLDNERIKNTNKAIQEGETTGTSIDDQINLLKQKLKIETEKNRQKNK